MSGKETVVFVGMEKDGRVWASRANVPNVKVVFIHWGDPADFQHWDENTDGMPGGRGCHLRIEPDLMDTLAQDGNIAAILNKDKTPREIERGKQAEADEYAAMARAILESQAWSAK